MKKSIFLMLSLALLFCSGNYNAVAQQKKVGKSISVTVKATNVDKSRGSNPNIKMDMPTTDEKREKSRGDYCSVYFNSYCEYYIKVFVDGDYYGMMSPYSSMTVRVYSGYTKIYCVSAGGTKEWNANGDCDGRYEYKLYCD